MTTSMGENKDMRLMSTQPTQLGDIKYFVRSFLVFVDLLHPVINNLLLKLFAKHISSFLGTFFVKYYAYFLRNSQGAKTYKENF